MKYAKIQICIWAHEVYLCLIYCNGQWPLYVLMVRVNQLINWCIIIQSHISFNYQLQVLVLRILDRILMGCGLRLWSYSQNFCQFYVARGGCLGIEKSPIHTWWQFLGTSIGCKSFHIVDMLQYGDWVIVRAFVWHRLAAIQMQRWFFIQVANSGTKYLRYCMLSISRITTKK